MLSDNNRQSATSMNKFNSEETLRVQECTTHKRMFEAYCTNCHVLICPTCLMFGEHKGHDVAPMESSSRSLREEMDAAAKQGVLKLEKTETVLVDIRHTKLTFEESRQKVLKDVENTFSAIFKIIKQRKDEVVTLINQHYQQQVTSIESQEQVWMDKQFRAYEVIKLAKQTNDYQILEKAPFILESLEILRQNPTYKNVYIVNSIDSTFSANNVQFNLSEFSKGLSAWVKLGEPVLIQFKC